MHFYPIVPDISIGAVMCYRNINDFSRALDNEFENYVYIRGQNPTVELLAKKISFIECAEKTLIVSSGVTAISYAIMTFLKDNSHVIYTSNPYTWTFRLLNKYLRKYHIRATELTPENMYELPNLIRENTKLIFVETPSSIFFNIFDIGYIAGVAREAGAKVIVDNSYCTGIYQKPLKLGADVSVNSLSKHINGHSDVVLGSISSSSQIIEKIFYEEYMTIGGIAHPLEAWLTLRGLTTLKLRLKKSEENANYIIEKLREHPRIEKILHPFYGDSVSVEIARKQMNGAPGLFSILIRARKIEDIHDFVHSLKHFKLGVSWGGCHSMVFPAAVFYKNPSEKHSIPWNLVRLYCGIQDKEILLNDLLNALDRV